MKRPNGYGCVFKLSGNRRRPFCARVTINWTEDGKQIYHTLGYYAKRQEAEAALVEYHKNPIGERANMTLEQIYEEWSASRYKSEKLDGDTIATYKSAWNHLSAIKDMPMKDIRKSHLQAIIDYMAAPKPKKGEQTTDKHGLGLGKSMCAKVKVLAGILFKYAMAETIVTQNFAQHIELPGKKGEKNEKDKQKPVFNDLEIKVIEEAAKTDIWASTVLILIYTGMRIGELLTLTKFQVDMERQLITGGIKTDAGKDRIVPIHPKIQPYIRYWYSQPGMLLIQLNGTPINQNCYRRRLYYPLLKRLNVRRLTPHKARHTFGTLLDKAGVNTKHIQELMGHSDYDITANTYTHPDIEALRKAINAI